MSENNYYNYYVETLTNTMTDAIIRNVSLQASVKVNEELVKEYDETIQLLDAEIGKLNEQLENERIARNENENSKIKFLDSEVSRLNSELNEIRNLKSEYDNIKHQVQHIDSFKKELLLSREENEKLRSEIENNNQQIQKVVFFEKELLLGREENTSLLDEIAKLKSEVEYLKLSPAKRKKLAEVNEQKEEDPVLQINNKEQTKDGGTF